MHYTLPKWCSIPWKSFPNHLWASSPAPVEGIKYTCHIILVWWKAFMCIYLCALCIPRWLLFHAFLPAVSAAMGYSQNYFWQHYSSMHVMALSTYWLIRTHSQVVLEPMACKYNHTISVGVFECNTWRLIQTRYVCSVVCSVHFIQVNTASIQLGTNCLTLCLRIVDSWLATRCSAISSAFCINWQHTVNMT